MAIDILEEALIIPMIVENAEAVEHHHWVMDYAIFVLIGSINC